MGVWKTADGKKPHPMWNKKKKVAPDYPDEPEPRFVILRHGELGWTIYDYCKDELQAKRVLATARMNQVKVKLFREV